MSSFVQMLSICLFWAIIFIIVFFITRRMGLNSYIPARVKELMKQTAKHFSSISDLYSDIVVKDGPKKALPDKKSVLKQLRMLSNLIRKADSLLQVHLYDNGEDVDISAVRSRLLSIISLCGDAARGVRTDDVALIQDTLESIQRLVSEILHILDEVCSRSEAEKLERL